MYKYIINCVIYKYKYIPTLMIKCILYNLKFVTYFTFFGSHYDNLFTYFYSKIILT